MDNKEKIQQLTEDLLKTAFEKMQIQIKRALNSSAIDIENWDENNNPMILPKIILTAILEDEADQYKATGTRWEKESNKAVKNLKLFL
jgi:hypothetical protein